VIGRARPHTARVLDFLGEMLADFIGGVIGALIGDRWRQRRAKRLERKGGLVCAFRVLEGSQPGLTRHWRHGKARLSPGAIDFSPKAPWARKASVPVRSASRLHQRQPLGLEAWVVDPRSRVVEVTTGTATLEWAVFGEQLRWVLTQVRQQAEEAVSTTE
jgi:hypothetical protein